MIDSQTVSDIRRRRKALGLGMKGLSLTAKLGETYVRDLERGRSKNPKTDEFNKLMDTLAELEAKANARKKGRA